MGRHGVRGLLICTLSAACSAEEAVPPDPGLPPTAMRLVGPDKVLFGSCETFTVITMGDDNLSANVLKDTPITVGTDGASRLYEDPNCTRPVTEVVVPNGDAWVLVYLKATQPEVILLTASADDLGVVELYVDIDALAGDVSGLGIAGPASITTNACAAYTVTSADREGNAAMSRIDLDVTLGGAGAGGFYSDDGCATGTTSVVIPSGRSSATFYFADATEETVTLDATAMNIDPGTLDVQVVVTGGAVDHLAVEGPDSITVGSCSAFTITAQDANDLATLVAAVLALSLSAGGGGQFYTDAGCTNATNTITIDAGQSSTTVYFLTLSPETNGFEVTAMGFDPAQLEVDSLGVPSFPTALSVDAPADVISGECIAVDVSSVDPLGNPANVLVDTLVDLGGAGGGSYYSDSGCTMAITQTTIGAGTNITTVYFRSDTFENVTLTATSAQLADGTSDVRVAVDPTSTCAGGDDCVAGCATPDPDCAAYACMDVAFLCTNWPCVSNVCPMMIGSACKNGTMELSAESATTPACCVGSIAECSTSTGVTWQSRADFDGGVYDANTFFDDGFMGGVLRSAAIADDFEDGVRDSDYWDIMPSTNGIGGQTYTSPPGAGSVVEQNGHLELTTNSMGNVAYGYQSRFTFTGEIVMYYTLAFTAGSPAIGNKSGAGVLMYNPGNVGGYQTYGLGGVITHQGSGMTDWQIGAASTSVGSEPFGAHIQLPRVLDATPVLVRTRLRWNMPTSNYWSHTAWWDPMMGWVGDGTATRVAGASPNSIRLMGFSRGGTPSATIAIDDFKLVGTISTAAQWGQWEDSFSHPTDAVEWSSVDCDCMGAALEFSADGMAWETDLRQLPLTQDLFIRATLHDSSEWIRRIEVRYIDP